ncbi:hypothetical protein H6G08_25640 [Calothrix anomala FACHB-343]|uniref:Uncharacterized protein n=2 Tax=Calothrix TaxID=1186 RepID=A0ABR8AGF1_9CYAN|nr:hypothetical protein [Calothrix parietina FACHB-288]MBD2227828.1 hypothetical protein [Calothrix anomala FACHB-343]
MTKKSQIAKQYINNVLQQLLIDYKNTRDERRQIAIWEESQDFSILGEIEIFATDIEGYASQVIANDDLGQYQEMIQKLTKMHIFDIAYFADWYFAEKSQFPQIKLYIEKLNYLRLLVIEYINDAIALQSQQTIHIG